MPRATGYVISRSVNLPYSPAELLEQPYQIGMTSRINFQNVYQTSSQFSLSDSLAGLEILELPPNVY